MEHHYEALEEVILSDSKIKRISQTLNADVLDTDFLNRQSAESLGKALAAISGVSVLQTGVGISKPVIHGMYGSRVRIIKNDFALEDHQWGADHAPNIDANTFDHLQLVKGAAVLRYGGNSPGGVIVLQPHRIPLKDSLYGKSVLTAASNGRGGTISTNLTRSFQNGFFLSASGTAKYYGDFHTPDYVLSNTGIRQQSISTKIGRNRITQGWEAGYSYFNTTIGILSASHIGNIEDLYRAIENPVPLLIKPFDHEINPPKQENNHPRSLFQNISSF